jgi:hypothetical protein
VGEKDRGSAGGGGAWKNIVFGQLYTPLYFQEYKSYIINHMNKTVSTFV